MTKGEQIVVLSGTVCTQHCKNCHVYEHSACVSICVPHVCLLPSEARAGLMNMLGIEPQSLKKQPVLLPALPSTQCFKHTCGGYRDPCRCF